MKARAKTYPAAIVLLFLAAAFLAPSPATLARDDTTSANAGAPNPSNEPGFGAATASPDRLPRSGVPRPQNATSMISDGTFDAIPGPWLYANGTSGAVTSGRDPTARGRLGRAPSALNFDSMDNIFGPNPWTNLSAGQANSSISQETTIRAEGSGSMRDDMSWASDNWVGARRDDPLPWNWSGLNRLAVRMNKPTSDQIFAYVYAQDTAGGGSWGFSTLLTGWARYAFDVNATLDASAVDFLEIGVRGIKGTTATIYIDDIVLFNATTFDETAGVAQTFTKLAPTGGNPNTLRLRFDLEATPSANVISYLEVAINGTAEWSETPVTAGNRTVSVDLSDNVAL